jgi:hypothetical protein
LEIRKAEQRAWWMADRSDKRKVHRMVVQKALLMVDWWVGSMAPLKENWSVEKKDRLLVVQSVLTKVAQKAAWWAEHLACRLEHY